MLNRILDRIPAKRYVFAILVFFIGFVATGELTKNLDEKVQMTWFFVGIGLVIGAAVLVWVKTNDWLNIKEKE